MGGSVSLLRGLNSFSERHRSKKISHIVTTALAVAREGDRRPAHGNTCDSRRRNATGAFTQNLRVSHRDTEELRNKNWKPQILNLCVSVSLWQFFKLTLSVGSCGFVGFRGRF